MALRIKITKKLSEKFGQLAGKTTVFFKCERLLTSAISTVCQGSYFKVEPVTIESKEGQVKRYLERKIDERTLALNSFPVIAKKSEEIFENAHEEIRRAVTEDLGYTYPDDDIVIETY